MAEGGMFNLGQSRAFAIKTITEEQAIKDGYFPSRSILGVMDNGSFTGLELVDALPTEGKGNTIYVLQDGRMFIWRSTTHQWQQTGGGGGGSIILYPTTGQNVDGAMTQKATTDNLDLKINEADFITNARLDEIMA